MDGLTGGNSDSEAVTELSRKQCLEIYTKAKKNRSEFCAEIQDILKCSFEKVKLDNIVRDMMHTQVQKNRKKAIDLEKIIISKSDGTEHESALENEEIGTNDEISSEEKGKKRKVHITDCKRHSLYDRTDELYSFLKETAERESIAPYKLAARLMSRSIWDETDMDKGLHKKIYDTGMKIFQTRHFTLPKLSPSLSLTIIADCELGRTKYNKLRQLCKLEIEEDIFPNWNKVNEYRNSNTPQIVRLPETYDGFKVPLIPAVQLTLTQILTKC